MWAEDKAEEVKELSDFLYSTLSHTGGAYLYDFPILQALIHTKASILQQFKTFQKLKELGRNMCSEGGLRLLPIIASIVVKHLKLVVVDFKVVRIIEWTAFIFA